MSLDAIYFLATFNNDIYCFRILPWRQFPGGRGCSLTYMIWLKMWIKRYFMNINVFCMNINVFGLYLSISWSNKKMLLYFVFPSLNVDQRYFRFISQVTRIKFTTNSTQLMKPFFSFPKLILLIGKSKGHNSFTRAINSNSVVRPTFLPKPPTARARQRILFARSRNCGPYFSHVQHPKHKTQHVFPPLPYMSDIIV